MDSNLIVLTDQDGNSVRFELLDIVEYKEDEYAVLYPADGVDCIEGAKRIIENKLQELVPATVIPAKSMRKFNKYRR